MRTYEFVLPSNGGANSVTFREPMNVDRRPVMIAAKSTEIYSSDELLAFQCLIAINGAPVKYPDPKLVAEDWSVKDTTAYTAFFNALFSLNQDDLTTYRDAAKKLMVAESAPASALTSEPS